MRKHLLPPCLFSLYIAGAAFVPKRHSTGGAASPAVPSASIAGTACNFSGMLRCLTKISAFSRVKLDQRNISPRSSINLAVPSPFSSLSVACSCLRRPCTFPHLPASHGATVHGEPPLLLPAESSRCLSCHFSAKKTNICFFFSETTRFSAKFSVPAAASRAPLARSLSVWPASASAATRPAVSRISASCGRSYGGGTSESSFFPSRAAQPPAFVAASVCSPAAPVVLGNHALLGEQRILRIRFPPLAGRTCAVFFPVSVRSTCFAVPSTMPPAGQEDIQSAPQERLSDGESTAGEAPTLRPPASPELKRQRTAEPPKRALETEDEELYELIRLEKKRQIEGLELIASENFTSQAVKECLGSCLTNKYSEGYPGARYYGGNQIIDKIESLCQRRALEAFGLDAKEWAVNVQPYSGSPANMAVYVGLLQAHDRIMGLDLPSGGHLTHGFYTAKKRVSATSIFFESLPYGVSEASGLIDYEELRKRALLFRPKLIICGHSAYPRDLDYAAFRSIADAVGAVLMCDMAHTSGLIAAGLLASPFQYCDVVTTTTHKSLRGPRSGMIFMNKKRLEDVEARINNAVFPALQGGPHDNSIAAVACQLREVRSDKWREYAKQVIQNSKALAKRLTQLGHRVVTGGTDNHLLVVDLRVDGITGAKMQLCCEEANISVNKNSVPGDTAAANPSGVRLGSPALTSRGMTEEHFEQIGTWLHEVIGIAKEIQETHGKKIADFQKGVQDHPRLQKLREQVVHFAEKFPMPGGDM